MPRCRSPRAARSVAGNDGLEAAILGAVGAEDLEALLACATAPELCAKTATSALLWIARLCRWRPKLRQEAVEDRRFRELCARLGDFLPEMGGAMTSSAVWALGELGARGCVQEAVREASRDLAALPPCYLARFASGLAMSDIRCEGVLSELPRVVRARLRSFSGPDACVVLWAMQRLYGSGEPELLGDLLHRLVAVSGCGGRFPRPRELADVVVECVSSGRGALEAFGLAASLFDVGRADFSGADVLGLVWAAARLERWEAAARLAGACADTGPADAARCALGVEAAGRMRARGLEVAALAPAALALRDLAADRCASAPAWWLRALAATVASGLCDVTAWLRASAEPLRRWVAGASAQEACRVAWCYAAAGVRHRSLLDACCERLSEPPEAWSDLADALWACAASEVAQPRLFAVAAERLLREPPADGEAAVRLAWAFSAALGDRRAEVVRKLLSSVTLPPPSTQSGCRSPDWRPLMRQILALSVAEGDSPLIDSGAGCLATEGAAPELAAPCSSAERLFNATLVAWRRLADAADDPGVSRTAGSSRLPVDVAVPSLRVAFDAAGRTSTMLDLVTGRCVPNGEAQLKRRILRREGWTLRLVPPEALAADGCGEALVELLRSHISGTRTHPSFEEKTSETDTSSRKPPSITIWQ